MVCFCCWYCCRASDQERGWAIEGRVVREETAAIGGEAVEDMISNKTVGCGRSKAVGCGIRAA